MYTLPYSFAPILNPAHNEIHRCRLMGWYPLLSLLTNPPYLFFTMSTTFAPLQNIWSWLLPESTPTLAPRYGSQSFRTMGTDLARANNETEYWLRWGACLTFTNCSFDSFKTLFKLSESHPLRVSLNSRTSVMCNTRTPLIRVLKAKI